MDETLSKPVVLLLAQLDGMPPSEAEYIKDLAFTAAVTIEEVRKVLDRTSPVGEDGKPRKRLLLGDPETNMIRLGSEAVPRLKTITEQLWNGRLDLETYIRRIQGVADLLTEVVEHNQERMKRNKVLRTHMVNLFNSMVVQAEAAAVLNSALIRLMPDP